jgi:hypothetical protein
MTQSSTQTWCERLQRQLMAALDAVWETIAATDDPAVIRKARDKAKACGDLAAMARRVAAMTPRPKPSRSPAGLAPLDFEPEVAAEERPPRKLDRLKGGGRGRL